MAMRAGIIHHGQSLVGAHSQVQQNSWPPTEIDKSLRRLATGSTVESLGGIPDSLNQNSVSCGAHFLLYWKNTIFIPNSDTCAEIRNHSSVVGKREFPLNSVYH